MNTTEPQAKYESLQMLRAIAAWMVVGHHFQQMFFAYNYKQIVSQFFVLRGSFGIDLFFVLSGFVMFLTARKANISGTAFFIRRVTRIAPAYWFFTCVLLIWVVLFPKIYQYTDYNSLSLLKSFLLIPNLNPSGLGLFPFLTPGWSLVFEMAFYTILAACIGVTRKYALPLCFCVIVLARFFFPDGFTYSPILTDSRILQFLFGLMIGWYITSPVFTFINGKIPASLQAAVMSAAAIFLMSAIFLEFSIAVRTVTASLFVLSLILIDKKINYENPIARFLVKSGNYSYSVYLSHIMVIGLFLHFTGPWMAWYYNALIVLGIFLTTHMVSATSYKYIENGKFVKVVRDKLLGLAS